MSLFGSQNMVGILKKVLMKKPLFFMSKVDFLKWNYTSPLNQELIEKNYNEFYNIIKKFGTEIIELKLHDESEELCDSTFTHDPSLVTNYGAIILNMGKNLRKKETTYHEKTYNKLEIPIIDFIRNEGTVEAGDCVWINEKNLIVSESQRTNRSGISQLKQILKSLNINLISFKLPKYINNESCFHLMSVISIIDQNLVIGCKSLVPRSLKNIFDEFKYDFLEIPEDEYFKSKTLAVNILALSPRNLVMLRGYPKTTDLLINLGCKIQLFSGNELCIKAEGGPTCLTRPIHRL